MLYITLNNFSPYANTFKPAAATSLVHNSDIVFLSQHYQQNYQNNSFPYHHHQSNISITKNTGKQSHYNKSKNKSRYYNNNNKHHQKNNHRYSQHLQQQQQQLKNYNSNPNNPIHHYNANINYQVSHEILQSLHVKSNGVTTIPEWEHCWLQNGYTLLPPPVNNKISMLAPDKSTHWHYFWQLIHEQQQKKQCYQKQALNVITPVPVVAPSPHSLLPPPPPPPPPHIVPLSPDMHYPPLPSSLNLTVSQQQPQQQQLDFVPTLYQFPRYSSRSVSIINPNTREQVTADPIIVKPASVAIKIKKPSVIEKEQHPAIAGLNNNFDDKNSYFPASTNNTTFISAATTPITKRQQKQGQTSTTIINVSSSVDNKDKRNEPIVEITTNNEQQQSTAINVNYDSSNEEVLVAVNNSNNINTSTTTKETTKLTKPDDTSSDETEEESSDGYDDNVTIASTISTSDNKEQFDNNTISKTKQRIQYSREFLLQLRYPSTQTSINDLSAIQPVTLPVLAPINTSATKRKSGSSFIFNKGYIENNYCVDTTTQRQPGLFTINIHNEKKNQQPWCFKYNNNEQKNKYFQQDEIRSRTTVLPKSFNQWIPSVELREKRLQHKKDTQNRTSTEKQYVLPKSSNCWIPQSKLHEKRLVKQNKEEKRFTTTTTSVSEVLPKSTHRWVPFREIHENNKRLTYEQEEEKNKIEQLEKQMQKELLSAEEIERKVKGLLNKLSSVNFDSISEQIWNHANGSIDNLKTVVRMIFDKACDEPNFATNWAKLCKRIQDLLSTTASFDTIIQDDTVKDKQGNPASGVYLYRCYLLNRCQEQFQMDGRWWCNAQQISLKNVEMLSDEYYVAMKQKRQGLGLVVFIGELYKIDMLTSKIVGHCLTKLMEDKECIGDEEVETACKLLSTIGESFDQVIQTKFWMNQYLQDMEKMIETNKKLSTRVKFKVMDVIDLRKNEWILKGKK